MKKKKNDKVTNEAVPPATTPVQPVKSKAKAGLAQEKARRLVELEVVIQGGKETFVEVGLALSEIRTQRLYKPEFKSFEAYCETRWDFKGAHAKRLIEAATVAQQVAPIGAIVRESHARELARVPAEKRDEVFCRAGELAKAAGHKVTAKLIAAAARGASVADLPPPSLQPSTLSKLRELWKDATPMERKRFLAWARGPKKSAQPRRAAKRRHGVRKMKRAQVVAPVEIRLDGATRPISAWNQVLVQVCEGLLAQGRGLPTVSFVRRTKRAFPRSARVKSLSNGAWLECGDDRQRLLAKTRRILAAAGNSTCVVRLQNQQELPLGPLPCATAKTPAPKPRSSAMS